MKKTLETRLLPETLARWEQDGSPVASHPDAISATITWEEPDPTVEAGQTRQWIGAVFGGSTRITGSFYVVGRSKYGDDVWVIEEDNRKSFSRCNEEFMQEQSEVIEG